MVEVVKPTESVVPRAPASGSERSAGPSVTDLGAVKVTVAAPPTPTPTDVSVTEKVTLSARVSLTVKVATPLAEVVDRFCWPVLPSPVMAECPLGSWPRVTT